MVQDLTVRDVMTHDYVGVSESDTVREVARLMVDEGETAVAVIRGTDPVGIATAGSLIGAFLDGTDPDTTRIDVVMDRPPRSVSADLTLSRAASILADADTDHVFVAPGDELLGVLSENDLITAVTSILATEPGEAFDDDYDAGVGTDTDDIGAMSAQSVCEVCGTLKTDLENINGQLVCDDCRSV